MSTAAPIVNLRRPTQEEAVAEAVAKGNYNPALETAKFFGGKVAKWTGIGLMIGAVALPAVGTLAGIGVLSSVPGMVVGAAQSLGSNPIGATVGAIGTALTGITAYLAPNTAKEFVGEVAQEAIKKLAYALGMAAVAGGALGGGLGALGGAIAGFSGAEANNDNEKDKIYGNALKAVQRQEDDINVTRNLELLQAEYKKSMQEYGIDPNANMNLPILERGGVVRG